MIDTPKSLFCPARLVVVYLFVRTQLNVNEYPPRGELCLPKPNTTTAIATIVLVI